ncbi:hypothetical protein C922_05289 [Plasmodium inui San Antonio 1]|uniref:Uncharacterized protein n=1 Tax=Plasmodium inui San Antonio 1 TaxID=1237626 RepID=W6ZYF5_9APIC|nr:hypothetical protein C922_05289 [Plasmodium inui San Antonio 1]EUD64330.1 hypothetical protein C922_05289 [Plasmodium inui San Antonio 1]
MMNSVLHDRTYNTNSHSLSISKLYLNSNNKHDIFRFHLYYLQINTGNNLMGVTCTYLFHEHTSIPTKKWNS